MFSVVIPIFNEEDNILELFEQLKKKKYNQTYEIIFVNDGSDDNSEDILISLTNKYPKIVRFISHKKNLGQSEALRSGIQSAYYDTIVTLDGDLQNNPDDIIKLLNIYKNKNPNFLISGIRKSRKDSFLKIISSIIANKFRSFILRDNCIDSGCALKVFSKARFNSFEFFDGIHRFLPSIYLGFDLSVEYVDVDHRHRINGKSKYGIKNRLFKGLKDVFMVRKLLKNK